MISSIWVRFSFIGWHSYPDAPDEVAYLRTSHRHTFNCRVELCVDPNVDRELEFHMVRGHIQEVFLLPLNKHNVGSCEQMAHTLISITTSLYPNRVVTATVDEDGECGATLTDLN